MASLMQNRNMIGFLFMLPAAVFLVCFLTYPLGLGVWLGFTDTRIGRDGVFIGLENYVFLCRGLGLLALGLQHASLHGRRLGPEIRASGSGWRCC